MSNLNEDFWCKWLKKYKSFRGLWDRQNEFFSDTSYQQEAWSELLQMAQENVDIDINFNYLQARLRHFIYTYKKEDIKLKIAKDNGINYEPKSYYKILRSIYESQEDINGKQFDSKKEENTMEKPFLERKYQEFWRKVLKIYVSNKCLWNENRKAHTNDERKRAWIKLTKLVQTEVPKADIHYVRRRINSCRSVYLREVKRIETAKCKGNVYEPKLYYFDILKQIYQKKHTVLEGNGLTSDEDCPTDDSDDNENDNKGQEDPDNDFNSEKSNQMSHFAALSGDKKLWRKVLKKYISFKCLWDNENRAKYTMGQRITAWYDLLDIVKKTNDQADLGYLKMRINNCRSIHARELRKVAKAKEQGKKYESKLFYCDILCAINRKDGVLPDFSSDESEDGELMAVNKEISTNLEEELKSQGYIFTPLQIVPQDLERRIGLELVTKYVFYKCIWDTKNRDNYKEYERDHAWQQLIEIARKGKPDADINYVRWRIKNMRTSYIRQFKKAKQVKDQGKDYEITLYYFNAFNPMYQKGFPILKYDESKGVFTKDESLSTDFTLNPINTTYFPEEDEQMENCQQMYEGIEDNMTPEFSNVKLTDDDDNTNNYEDEDFAYMETTPTIQEDFDIKEELDEEFLESNLEEIPTEASKNYESLDFLTVNPLVLESNASKDKPLNVEKICKKERKILNKFDTFAERIALHLESMENQQYLLAEKFISDVCIAGRLNELTKQSRLNLKN